MDGTAYPYDRCARPSVIFSAKAWEVPMIELLLLPFKIISFLLFLPFRILGFLIMLPLKILFVVVSIVLMILLIPLALLFIPLILLALPFLACYGLFKLAWN